MSARARAWRKKTTALANNNYKYQLCLTDPRDKIVLQTERGDLCDKLRWSSVEARRQYLSATVQFITLGASTFLELS